MNMKKIFLTISLALCCLFTANTIYAQEQQESLRERLARRQQQQNQQGTDPASRQLTTRAQIMNQSQTQEIGNAPWVREIYRFLDLQKEKNAALYYPVRPMGDRMNLFTMLFKRMLDGSIDVYEYQLDGSEDFSDKFKRNPEDILKSFEIMYTLENGRLIVDDIDIPSNEVLGYYIKEAWYFDKNNSVVDIKTLAICPVMIRQDDFGADNTRYPMFWVPYENIRPYASQMPIMVSSLNNASTQTINDFFIKHNFDGEIYKTTNVRNLSLAQMFPNDSLIKKEQKKIETQLEDFQNNLWVYSDSIAVNNEANSKAVAETSKGDSNNNSQVQRRSGQQKSSPIRSMRNRNRN